MAFAPKDRVQDTTTTTGTGALTLAGSPPTSFQSFSAVGNGNNCPYTIVDAATGAWESGVGTYSSTGPTLTRDTVLASSNSGSLVSFAAGTKDVFCAPSAALVGWQQIGSTVNTTSGSAVSFTSIPAFYSDLMLVFEGVSHNSGSNQQFTIELSPDGSTWTGAANLFGATVAAAATIYGALNIPGYCNAAMRWHGLLADLSTNNTQANSASERSAPVRMAGGVNALRISVAAGAFDAGTIKLFARL